MKLCIVSLDFIPFRSSGLAIYGEKLVKGLAKKHDITVITQQPEGTQREEYIDNVKVIRIPLSKLDKTKWISFGYKASKLVSKLDKKEKFDIVHFTDVHFGYAYSKPFVATLHQSFNQRLKGAGMFPYHSSLLNLVERYVYYNLAKTLEKKAVKKAFRLASVSDATKKEFVKNYNITSSKIEVIYNGIDTNFFHPVDPHKLKKDLGIVNNQKILLYVGFTTPRKGVEYLADALKEINHDFILIMIGKWESGYKEIFYQHVDEMSDKILEVGYVDDKDMPYYYSLADIFVLPSLLEGFGFPLAEALSCETTVVSTNVGSIPEVVGECGIIVPPMDATALANGINRLIDDDDLRRKFGICGRSRVNKYFSDVSMINKMIEFYESL